MSRRSLQIAALVVGIITLASSTHAFAGPLAGAPHGQPPRLVASLWGNLASLWSAAGCEIDPSGKCVSSHGSAVPVPAGRGVGHGRLVNVRNTAGCEIDPDGRSVKSPGTLTCGAAGAGAVTSTAR